MTEEKIKKLEKEIAHLRDLAYKDELTEVSNRRGFEHEFGPLFQAAHYIKNNPGERRRIKIDDFSVLYIDLDDFKKINDTRGHDAGDIALKKVAQILDKNIRDLDEAVRLGGEEFLVVLVGAGEEKAFEKAEELRLLIEKEGMTASIGVSSLSESSAEKLFDLVSFADKAMYEAKKNRGKNNTARYSEL